MLEEFFAQARIPQPDRRHFAKHDDARYLKLVWFRLCAIYSSNTQSEIAARTGVALSTLNRYFTDPSAASRTSCPYSVQFTLECLAGMEMTGQVYQIEASGTLNHIQNLKRFGGTDSLITGVTDPSHASIMISIALTDKEVKIMKKYFLEQNTLAIKSIRPESKTVHSTL